MSYKPERAEIGASAWRQDLTNVTWKILPELKLKHLVGRWVLRIIIFSSYVFCFYYYFIPPLRIWGNFLPFRLLGFAANFRHSGIPSFCILGSPVFDYSDICNISILEVKQQTTDLSLKLAQIQSSIKCYWNEKHWILNCVTICFRKPLW